MSELKIITVATEPKYYFNVLKESIKKNNNELIVLGYGEKWKGFSWRYNLMIEYLNSINPNDIVCFIDGYDVISTRDLNELPNIFKRMKKEYNCKIIVGYERHLNYIYKYIFQPFFGKCKNMPLNAGTYIGYAKDLLIILKELYKLNDPFKDDQMVLIDYCVKNPEEVYIDIKSELFLALGDSYNDIKFNSTKSGLIIKDKKLYYNQKEPFFFHGFANSYMDNILIELGYKNINVNNELKNNYYKNSYSKLYSFLYNIHPFIQFLLFFIIIILCIFIGLFIYKKNNKRIRK
jgi:hypothetical protein